MSLGSVASSLDWEALTPRGFYAERVRGPLLYVVTLWILPLAVLIGLPIACLNAWVLGSPRRLLFTQPRVGWRGRVFVLFKFRTMREGLSADDARVTRFGRFLRNTHLDELPQLWNVLRGEMCLIGPRPEMLATERWALRACPDFFGRLALKPGLTGEAQVTQGYTDGGDEHAYREKERLNRLYRERLGLARDLRILLATASWMVRGRGWRRRSRQSGRGAPPRDDE